MTIKRKLQMVIIADLLALVVLGFYLTNMWVDFAFGAFALDLITSIRLYYHGKIYGDY